MKLLVIIGGLIIFCLTLTYLIPVTKENRITVNADLYDIVYAISNSNQWKKWHPAVKTVFKTDPSSSSINNKTSAKGFTINTHNHSFTVKAITPIVFQIAEKKEGNLFAYRLSVDPSSTPGKVKIFTEKKVRLFNFFFNTHNLTPDEITVESLKDFVEDPAAFYGYSLTLESVIDTNVVIKRRTVATINWRDNLAAMFEEINNYITINNLKITQPKIVYLKNISNDSMVVMAGISVNKTAPSDKNIQSVQMPKGRMLVGEYEGPYYNRKDLYNAMEKYVSDKKMQHMAVPYERYLNDSIPATDSTIVKLKIYFPVL